MKSTTSSSSPSAPRKVPLNGRQLVSKARVCSSQEFDSSTFRRALLSLFAFLHPYRYYDWDAYERQPDQRKVAGYWLAGAAC